MLLRNTDDDRIASLFAKMLLVRHFGTLMRTHLKAVLLLLNEVCVCIFFFAICEQLFYHFDKKKKTKLNAERAFLSNFRSSLSTVVKVVFRIVLCCFRNYERKP